MRIAVDIAHFPHFNFYKYAINLLEKQGVDVDIIVQPRGNLTRIIDHESGWKYQTIGQYKSSMAGKITNLFTRDLQVLKYLKDGGVDAVTGVGSINMTHGAFALGKPSVMFEDDVEYKMAYYPYKYLASYIVVPSHLNTEGKNILRYRGYKELAYLHPNHFTPSTNILREYGISPRQYVFVREVSNSSLNYSNLNELNLLDVCRYLKDLKFDIVLSLENKAHINKYKDYCIILNEPVKDIHSLLHHASLTIASGDSMARESCLVGTPAIYTGNKNMSINRDLIERGCFFKVDNVTNVVPWVKKIVENDIKKETEAAISRAIKGEWYDTTQVINDVLLGVLRSDEGLIKKYR
jgi:hypothetical protein